MEVVLPNGDVVNLGSSTLDAPGYDLAGVFVGAEGTLGVVTKVILRVVKNPANVDYDRSEEHTSELQSH